MTEAPPTVRFLGSGDAFGSGGRLQACILLDLPAGRTILECGASSLVAMKRFGVDPNSIDTILISHLHGDHFGGLPFFVLDAQLVSRRTRPLTIAGPPGLADRTRAALEVFFPGSSQTSQKFEIRFVELAERTVTRLGEITVTAVPVIHASGAPAYALRVTGAGRTVAYSGDTEWTETLREAARDADLFICEAYFFEKKMKFHLDYQTLRDRQDELGCRRIILTHLSDDLLRRRNEIEAEIADDGLAIAL